MHADLSNWAVSAVFPQPLGPAMTSVNGEAKRTGQFDASFIFD
jgi:hypothetical protein